MPITALPALVRTSATFKADVDTYFGTLLPNFASEANATAVALTLASTNDTSATSQLIATGAKTFTVSSGKSFQPGMYLVISDTAAASTNSMYGQVTTYTTNQLVMNILSIRGSGTKTAWTISQSAAGFGTAADITNTPAGAIAATNVQAAINELDVEKANIADIQAQTYLAFTTAGTLTAYTLTPVPAIATYAANQLFYITFAVASGASPTLAINGLATPPSLMRRATDGTLRNIVAGEIPAGFAGWVVGISATQYEVTGLPTTRAFISASSDPFRNRCINGNMFEDQVNAGAAQTVVAAAAYAPTLDMFFAYCTGANVTAQQTTVAGLKRQRFTGAAAVTGIGLLHSIEAANSADLAGQTCTFSVKLANSLLTTVNWQAFYANTADTFGTLAAPTRTSIASGSFTVTAAEAVYSAQIAVPAAATTGIEIVLTVAAQTSGTWDSGEFQLERGAIPAATVSFERVDAGINRARAQRYYQRIGGVTGVILGSGVMLLATEPYVYGALPVSMRAAPAASIDFAAAGLTQVTNGVASATGQSATITTSPSTYSIDIAGSTTQVVNGAVVLRTASATQFLNFSARLH